MPIFVLKTIRYFVPAGLLYLLLVLFCWASAWCSLAVPENYETITKSLLALALGGIYYALPLREYFNDVYFNRVNQSLINQLTLPFKVDPNFPKELTWNQVRRVFYPFVDNDKSLKHLKGLAFWNGAIWTSAADVRASCIGIILFALVMLFANIVGSTTFDNAKATYSILLLAVVFTISIPLSELITQRHIKIGTQQAEYIRLNHRNDLRDKLIRAAGL
jgi:hypothetical protein